jgi:hypothetical protein
LAQTSEVSKTSEVFKAQHFSENLYKKTTMASSTLTQILLGSLLDSPAVVELASQAGKKAFSIVKEYFTYGADQITIAYQDGFAYAVVAISVGVKTPDETITQKIFNAKITRDFADKIEQHYLQPFTQAHDIESLPDFRKQTVKALKFFAKHKDKGNKIGHWVVVDGIDETGIVLIRDPYEATKYKMNLKNFQKTWNGFAVWRQ